MKICYFFCFSLVFSLIFMFSVYAACINTADNYATEVLLNKKDTSYNIKLLDKADNLIIKDNKYVLQSVYNSNLALILEEQLSPLSGLSVRLQIPVKSEEKNLPYFKFSLISSKENLSISNEEIYNGWEISCSKGNPPTQCEFNKEKTSILASLISKKYEIVIETREELKDCLGCDGKCIISSQPKCIDKKLKKDIEDILEHSGLISLTGDIFSSYKIISIGNAIVTDLTPSATTEIDWGGAMKQELERLRKESMLSIANSDIEDISKIAKQGKSGQNSRIVYGEDTEGEEKWLYYYETKFPFLTKLENCQEFSPSLVPTGMLIFSESEISAYYLVPIILTLSLIALLVILIIVARIIIIKKGK